MPMNAWLRNGVGGLFETFRRPHARKATAESPLRAELFSADQMEEHGRVLAASHRLLAGKGHHGLLARLDENETVLLEACGLLSAAIRENRRVSPASEWLLDNYYLIDEHLRTARLHLPKGYSSQLPRLAQGPQSGLPRIYDLALNAISHGDGRFDHESLHRFVSAYQDIAPLSLGELWAIPIMLRLALVENLRRVAARVAMDRRHRNLAAAWGERMAQIAAQDPRSLILAVADMARSDPPASSSFVAELMQRLQNQKASLAVPVSWLEQRLAEDGLTIEQLVQSENQQQAADQLSVSNSIGSLRLLLSTDWRGFVERLSRIEAILATDPAGVYTGMSFATRDAYRQVVERLARKARRAESDVAQAVVDRARDAADHHGIDAPSAHVGHHLVDAGLGALEQGFGLRPTPRYVTLPRYLGSIVLATAAIVCFAWMLLPMPLPGHAVALISLPLLIAASQLALVVVNAVSMFAVAPKALPRMDFSRGIPAVATTLVVVPTLLDSTAGAREDVDNLEIRYLANRMQHLHYALLSDHPDARTEHTTVDAAVLAVAVAGIERLNRVHAAAGGSRFFLLHRPRRWNAGERVWMGEERKRGKLGDLNALLRGKAEGRFACVVGDQAVLRTVRYVITLDADTRLPHDAAHELVATIHHPLNRPRIDADGTRVVSGHGILQPRVGTTFSLSGVSGYTALLGGDPGLDPYTRAVSDVYQDLFGEGSFTGKGIYDVDAFESTLDGRFPANRILSHDLLEGCHARAGLASDVAVFEDFPRSYVADITRRHRWIRGDWQIARWLLPRVPSAGAGTVRNPLSALSRWKIFDNLRRSLVAPAQWLLFVLGWLWLPGAAAWTVFVLALTLVPIPAAALSHLARKPPDARWRAHAADVAAGTWKRLVQALFALACLPFEAWVAADAILRTSWRLHVSHRRLLEWTPSRVVERGEATRRGGAFRSMAFAPLSTLGLAIALAYLQPATLPLASPVLLLWLASPLLARRISRVRASAAATLDPVHEPLLRDAARRTWHFFERHVGALDNGLPPDNYQQQPGDVVAHRTSPTNIGLSLLASLAAHDFGYLSLQGLLRRTQATLDGMDKLERHRGHLYNWYDTRTLAPLRPRYVSMVDSGNLAGHLLTLRQGLLALRDHVPRDARVLPGLRDTAGVLHAMAPESGRAAVSRFLEAARRAEHAQDAGDDGLEAALADLLAMAQPLCDAGWDEDGAGEWARALLGQCSDALAEVTLFSSTPGANLHARAETGCATARDWLDTARALAERAAAFAEADYRFLYDAQRDLFGIGFNVDDHRLDAGYYDLLASEARLGVFIAVAQGQVPQEAWFSLGRLLTHTGGTPVLLSWSGSMFEYLMPNLVMPMYPQSLLAQTAGAAVARQIAYGRERGVPWGISECGYHLTDAAQNYQYRAFGVPGLGLQRGLSKELVIAPYASALALLVAPNEAAANLARQADQGWLTPYGYYEAVDYSDVRNPPGQRCAIVRSFMAHHQGMSLLAFAHVLLGRTMQRRFEADPQMQSALLLLQERVPRAGGRPASDPQRVDARSESTSPAVPLRVFHRPDPATPAVQLLSNGRYHVMLTSAGGGYSRWRDVALTRWREDPTRDAWGSFCYLAEVGADRVWSTTHQPTLQADDHFEAVFTEARVEFRRRLDAWEAHTEIVVSPEDDIELRRTRITNRAAHARTLDVTSYAEVVLAPAISDDLHQAFSNLFVQTEIVAARDAILCSRRPRDARDAPPWMFHLMAVHDGVSEGVSFETDRARFIGRRRTTADPRALDRGVALSGTQGSVLDPVVAIRHRITVPAGGTVHLDLVTGIGTDREHCLQLVDTYRDRHLADRVIDLAWTHSQVSLRQINISEAEAQTYARLAGRMLYSHAALRSEAHAVMRNRRGQPGLWAHAISGDLPIMVLQVSDATDIGLARDAVHAHAYWRLKGLVTDLVIWNEERGGYRQNLHDALMGMIAASVDASQLERPGGIFMRAAERISHEDRLLLLAVARVVMSDRRGGLLEHLERQLPSDIAMPRLAAGDARPSASHGVPASSSSVPLLLDNGLGGFSADGREYVITTDPDASTPAPWINVIANPGFGCIVSESGAGYTWRENAHEYRLTPWRNDPVSDAAGEAFYVRDEDSGRYWSPTALPAPGQGRYVTRHGFGCSVFEHEEDGVLSEQRVYVATEDAVKFVVIRLHNASGRPRALSVTGYVEWVLGDLASKSAMHVVTELDPDSGALLARNPFHPEFGDVVSFFDVDDARRTLSGDRLEFIGRNGHLGRPAAMARTHLSGRVGALMDPCGAIQVPFELEDGQSREIIFRIGAAATLDDACALIRRYRTPGSARAALDGVRRQWTRLLGAIELDTPDPALNALGNGWLLYQVIACRLWARSGYYQSGGAFGFRDQLQDTMALVHAAPELLRAQLLLCAQRQFKEGDVQHWWHPPSGRGVRTRCSDDYLWLPLAACRYIACSGDAAVLDVALPFLDGRPLAAGEESYYDLPLRWDDAAPLYEHCVRAIRHGLRMGAHGLPLIGSGDWNDGMNNVGKDGLGESVWLGFFLYRVLLDFAPLARRRGDEAFARHCESEAADLQANLERHGWDGAWYRRAYFDDGTPLGSASRPECRVDAIAQSWAVLSGAAPDERAQRALDAVGAFLVRPQAQLIQLLDPPFDTSDTDPGYIRGYVPGVRENGGQYTHAAIWTVMAFVEAGRVREAWALFDMINPLRHATTPQQVDTYKVEPYVAAADVYAVEPHAGRGGWTWYTGSAGWMYRLIVESLLGLRREGTRLHVAPRLPAEWPGFGFTYRFGATVFRCRVTVVDDEEAPRPPCVLELVDDGAEHAVAFLVARPRESSSASSRGYASTGVPSP